MVSDFQIGCIKAEDATLEVIAPIIVKLKVAIEAVIVDVKVLASVPSDRVLCTLVGGVLDALSIAKLLACLLNVGTFGVLFASGLLTPLCSSSSVPLVPFLLLLSSLSRPRSSPSLLRLAASLVLSSAVFSALSTASYSRSSCASFPRLPAASASSRSWTSRSSLPSSVSSSKGKVKVSHSWSSVLTNSSSHMLLIFP